MPDIVVAGPDGNEYSFPEGTSRETMRAAMEKRFPKPPSRTSAAATGAWWGVQNIANTFTGAIANLVDKFNITPADAVGWAAEHLSGFSPAEAQKITQNLSSLHGFGEIVKAGSEAQRQSVEPVRRARPNAFLGGQLAGETFITAPVTAGLGGGLARAGNALVQIAPKAGAAAKVVKATGRAAAAVGKSTASGGIGVRGVTKEALARGAPIAATRGGRAATRVAGGALSGATAAALTDQDISSGAIFGAGLPVAGVIAKNGAGWTFDFLTRRMGEVRAAEVMRNLIRENGAEIADALKTAPKNIAANTAEFLAQKGLLTPELAAATRIVGASKSGKPLETVARRRAAGQEELKSFIRGGGTQTEAIGSTEQFRRGMQTETAPMREDALRAADVGRTLMVPAERRANVLDAVASEINRSGFVRRMRGLEGRAEEQAAIMGDNPAIFPDMENIQRTRGIAGAAGQRADTALEGQLQLRDTARAYREAAENLRAQGLEPLDINPIVGKLRSEATTARYVNPTRERVLFKFADNLEARARMQGGIIDATGLYELRKNMGDTIADILGPTDPSSLQKYTAQIIGETQPLIDNAIESAGGKGWRQYLDTFSQGMRQVERQTFERELTKLPEARYIKVMAGEDPDFVAQHFGPGRYDINVELMGPKLPAAHELAGQIGATRAAAQTGLEELSPSQRLSLPAGARARATGFMEPALGNKLFSRAAQIAGGIPGVYGGGQLANQLEQEAANRMRENVAKKLAPALAQPSAAARLMPAKSATEYMSDVSNFLSPAAKNVLSQIVLGYKMSPFVPDTSYNAAPEGQVLLGYDTGPSGERYPVYGYSGAAPR